MTSYSGTVEGNMIEIRKNDWSDDVERDCIPCIAGLCFAPTCSLVACLTCIAAGVI
jgi:hypothetical protein